MAEATMPRRERLKRVAFQFELEPGEAERLREMARDESMAVATMVRRWVRQRLREDATP